MANQKNPADSDGGQSGIDGKESAWCSSSDALFLNGHQAISLLGHSPVVGRKYFFLGI